MGSPHAPPLFHGPPSLVSHPRPFDVPFGREPLGHELGAEWLRLERLGAEWLRHAALRRASGLLEPTPFSPKLPREIWECIEFAALAAMPVFLSAQHPGTIINCYIPFFACYRLQSCL